MRTVSNNSDLFNIYKFVENAAPDTYGIPLLSDEVISQLDSNKDIIFNKDYKSETYKNNALFYSIWTCPPECDYIPPAIVYFYGYKPVDKYKYIKTLGNLYMCSNSFFYYTGSEPLTTKQHHNTLNIFYNFD